MAKQTLVCSLCKTDEFVTAESLEALREHVSWEHLQYKPLNCTICSDTFPGFIALNDHRLAVHSLNSDEDNANGFQEKRNVVLEQTLDGLVKILSSKETTDQVPEKEADDIKATEQSEVVCALCSVKKAESEAEMEEITEEEKDFTDRVNREEHIFSHLNAERSSSKRGRPRGRGRKTQTPKQAHRASRSFWILYARCFPRYLDTDILDDTAEIIALNNKKTTRRRRARGHILGGGEESSDGQLKREESGLESEGQIVVSKFKNESKNTSKEEKDPSLSPDSKNESSYMSLRPRRKRPAPGKYARLFNRPSELLTSDSEGDESEGSREVKRRRDSEVNCIDATELLQASYGSTRLSGSPGRTRGRSRGRGRGGRPRGRPSSYVGGFRQVSEMKDLVDVIRKRLIKPEMTAEQVFDFSAEDGEDGLNETELNCYKCGEIVPKMDIYHHAAVRHLSTPLWHCSVCAFEDVSYRVVCDHAKICHEGDSGQVRDSLNEQIYSLRSVFLKCYPSKRFFIFPANRQPPSAPVQRQRGGAGSKSLFTSSRRTAALTHLCGECKARVGVTELKEHVMMHMAQIGYNLYLCQFEECQQQFSTKQDVFDHFDMHHPNTPAAFLDQTSLPESRDKYRDMAKSCFSNVKLCKICYEPVSSQTSDHVWKHLFDVDKDCCRFECRSCIGKKFSLDLTVKNHLTVAHKVPMESKLIESAMNRYITDHSLEYKETFIDQWKDCFPGDPVDISSFVFAESRSGNAHMVARPRKDFIHCKLCAVDVTYGEAESHVYWHIARMFSLHRYKCVQCETSDYDVGQLLNQCALSHSPDESLIMDQSKLKGSSLPKVFEACAKKCFNEPFSSLFARCKRTAVTSALVNGTTTTRKKMEINSKSQNRPARVVLPGEPMVTYDNEMFDRSEGDETGLACALCSQNGLATDSQLTGHAEFHVRASVDAWNRYSCNICGFCAPTIADIEQHNDLEHLVGFPDVLEFDCPSAQEIAKMRRVCFDDAEIGVLLDAVVDQVCNLVDNTAINGEEIVFEEPVLDCSFLNCASCQTLVMDGAVAHVRAVHGESCRFKCKYCVRSFGTLTLLNNHLQVVHPDKLDHQFALDRAESLYNDRMKQIVHNCFGEEIANASFNQYFV